MGWLYKEGCLWKDGGSNPHTMLEVFDLLFVLDEVFLKVRFQICCYLWGPRTGAVNLDILSKRFQKINIKHLPRILFYNKITGTFSENERAA